jgi:hypothetical protein
MLYIKMNNGRAIGIMSEEERTELHKVGGSAAWANTQNRNDWRTFAEVEAIARDLTELSEAGYWGPGSHRVYLPVDKGEGVSPRYDVVAAPKAGDAVSYAFNGDSYPCGHVLKVSADHRIITTREEDGQQRKFYRRKLSAAWINNGTWSLTMGHTYTQNPSF